MNTTNIADRCPRNAASYSQFLPEASGIDFRMRSMTKNIGIFILLYLSTIVSGSAQTHTIDSLKSALHLPAGNKLSILFELCKRGESMPSDSMMAYSKEAERISLKQQDVHANAEAKFYVTRSVLLKGHSDSALKLCDNNLVALEGKNDLFDVYYKFMWLKIVSLTKLRNIKESIAQCFQLLNEADKNVNARARVIAFNNLGVNNNILGARKEALNWFYKAWRAIPDTAVEKEFAIVFTNLAATNFRAGKMDSGFFFLHKALRIARETENLRTEADCYTLQGSVYSLEDKADSAIEYLKKAFVIQKQIGNVQFILVGLDALETFYAQRKNYPVAISYIRQAESYSKMYHEPLVLTFYQNLAECFKLLNNYKSYGEVMDTVLMIKDSLFQKSKTEDLAKLEAQYNASSREAFIAKQKLELLHKNIWIAVAAITATLILTGGILAYYLEKRRQKAALNEAEEKERRRIAADLHDNIGAYATAISLSIDEIERDKIITSGYHLTTLKSNAAEIISSLRDTIWAFNKEDVTVTGISDRLKTFAQKIAPSYPDYTVRIEESFERNFGVSPVLALHLFRIIQEAIHNALRHSHGSEVIIRIETDDGGAVVSITDNGLGFDPIRKYNEGNGLQNMQSRSAEAGLEFSISGNEPKGTIVKIVLPHEKNT